MNERNTKIQSIYVIYLGNFLFFTCDQKIDVYEHGHVTHGVAIRSRYKIYIDIRFGETFICPQIIKPADRKSRYLYKGLRDRAKPEGATATTRSM